MCNTRKCCKNNKKHKYHASTVFLHIPYVPDNISLRIISTPLEFNKTPLYTYEHHHRPVIFQGRSENRTDSLSLWTLNIRERIEIHKYEEIAHSTHP